jgi:hypothetical protein
MRCFSIVGTVLFMGGVTQGQISYSDHGQAIYCSNGLSAVRSGSFSDGTNFRQYRHH